MRLAECGYRFVEGTGIGRGVEKLHLLTLLPLKSKQKVQVHLKYEIIKRAWNEKRRFQR